MSFTIPSRGHHSCVLGFTPLKEGNLCIKGIILKLTNFFMKIKVDEKGFPIHVIDEL